MILTRARVHLILCGLPFVKFSILSGKVGFLSKESRFSIVPKPKFWVVKLKLHIILYEDYIQFIIEIELKDKINGFDIIEMINSNI